MGTRIVLVLLLLTGPALLAQDRSLGLWTRDLSQGERAALPEGEPMGTLVGAVFTGSAAAEAGILDGDRIVGTAGQTITSDEAFTRALWGVETADPVLLEIRRDGAALSVEVVRVDSLTYLGVACDSGEGLACKDLATAYRHGDDVPRNPAKAAALLRRGCKLGAVHACTILASRTARGDDGLADPSGGVALMKWACRNGDGEACRTMAEYHAGGWFGLEKSRARRRDYHAMGCEAGNRTSCNEVGKALEDGDGGPEDPKRAAWAYEAGCARDLVEACVWLGWLQVKGKGVPVDVEGGSALFERGCESGYFRGCISQAQVLLKQDDGQRALRILEGTCDQGHEEACCLMAQVHEKALGGVRWDVPRAARIFERLCREGHGHACQNLGFIYHVGREYMAGNGIEKDEARSLALYERACDDLDYMPACWHVGVLYAEGDKVPRDSGRGRALLQKACDAGLSGSCLWLQAHAQEALPEDEGRRAAVWATRRARGEMAPGRMHYTGQSRVQGQTHPIAVTITIHDRQRAWEVYEEWTFGGDSGHMEVSELEKDTLFLLRHTSQVGERVLRELKVEDGWVAGWSVTPDSPDPREQIYIDAPEPIFAWGAGIPQVIATLPLAKGYRTTFWNIKLTDRVISRKLEVVARGRFQIPAGTFTAWEVIVRASEPGGHDMTFWIDTQSRQVLRYGARTKGPGPDWVVTLDPARGSKRRR